MRMTRKQIIKLSEGVPPWQIHNDWDCALVIEYLSKSLLSLADEHKNLKDRIVVLESTIRDV